MSSWKHYPNSRGINYKLLFSQRLRLDKWREVADKFNEDIKVVFT